MDMKIQERLLAKYLDLLDKHEELRRNYGDQSKALADVMSENDRLRVQIKRGDEILAKTEKQLHDALNALDYMGMSPVPGMTMTQLATESVASESEDEG